MKIKELTLSLFKTIISKNPTNDFIKKENLFIDSSIENDVEYIKQYLYQNNLSAIELNKSFHKSWSTIESTPKEVLLIQQICHYISKHNGEDVYIPKEYLNTPEDIQLNVFKASTKEEVISKCEDLLFSGIALKTETIKDLVSLLSLLEYDFESNFKSIRNNEAKIIISDDLDIYPEEATDFLRYVVYKMTSKTLFIKDQNTLTSIQNSNFNPRDLFVEFGLKKLSEIFNRNKKIFLSMKTLCPKEINKISKLSKTFHKPINQSAIDLVTQKLIEDKNVLKRYTIYNIFKALNALKCRINGQETFTYKVRNGRSYTKTVSEKNLTIWMTNYNILMDYLKEISDLSGVKVYIPKNVDYALPTSEKMFLGNIPFGTKIYGDNLVVGMYWKDSYGASDLDLSALNLTNKIGWNGDYCSEELIYSGDITSAPRGAIEYLYNKTNLKNPFLILGNIYNGVPESSCKIILGEGDDINKDYLMNPNNLIFEEKISFIKKQDSFGMLITDKKGTYFTPCHLGMTENSVSGENDLQKAFLTSLYQEFTYIMSLNDLIVLLNGEIVDDKDNCDIDLSLKNLTKEKFIKIFKSNN